MAAIKGDKALAEFAKLFDVHPRQITAWKRLLEESATRSFGPGPAASDAALRQPHEFHIYWQAIH